LVLLPGLDGTGELFVDFIAALPESWTATTVTYPTDRFLRYADLRPFVGAAVPQLERFVLVAESFSTPLAVWHAATNPPNLAAVVICAGFIASPVHGWSGTMKALAKPWLFRLKPPRTIVEHFLLGQNAPSDLLLKLRHALQRVSPDVLSGRVQEVLDCDARDDLRRTTVPLLYLEAVYDTLLSSSCKKEFSHFRPDTLFGSVPAPQLASDEQSPPDKKGKERHHSYNGENDPSLCGKNDHSRNRELEQERLTRLAIVELACPGDEEAEKTSQTRPFPTR
jgi:pimeloyl-ACP methyl ester carboxylesterase